MFFGMIEFFAWLTYSKNANLVSKLNSSFLIKSPNIWFDTCSLKLVLKAGSKISCILIIASGSCSIIILIIFLSVAYISYFVWSSFPFLLRPCKKSILSKSSSWSDNEKTFFKSSLTLFPKFMPYFSIMSSSKIFNFLSYICSEKYFFSMLSSPTIIATISYISFSVLYPLWKFPVILSANVSVIPSLIA